MGYNQIQTYLQEAEELIADIEQSALALGADEDLADTVHRLFRAFHTIKGSGAMCGLVKVADFTHHVETLLDRVREGAVTVSPELAALVLAAADHIKMLLAAETGGEAVAAESSESLIEKIAELSVAPGSREPEDSMPAPAPANHEGQERTWKIRFRPSPSIFVCGGNPILLLRDLRKLGQCDIEAHTEEVPPLDRFDPDLCYFWWSVTLRGACDENAIRDVFIFVEDGSNLEIEMLPPAPPRETAPAAQTEAPPHTAAAPVGESARKAPVKESMVRVPASRLDRLVNLVGELVMNQSRLTQVASQLGAPEPANPAQEIERLVAELREDVLEIRMLPIGTIFGRFRRLVHDLAAELGKETDLITEGAETELDKSILDQLGDPLVHLLRNSMDHGIESPETRAGRGKPRRGAIRLTAGHAGSEVVIRIPPGWQRPRRSIR